MTVSRPARTGLKAALAAAGAVGLLSSGVAFATTGHVPFAGTLKQVTRQVTGHADDAAGKPGSGPKSSSSPWSDGSNGPNGPKVAALQGLCQAYTKGQKADHGKALAQRPLQTLVAAAGGEDQVADFCASLPPKAHQGGPGPTDQAHPTRPTQPTHPTNGPSTGPTDHPTGRTHPTKPAHPDKPTQAASPTSKPKPSQATQKPPEKPSRTKLARPTR